MRTCLVALLLLTACTRARPPETIPPRAPPRVVVALVVDQLAAWVAAERFPHLPSDGGFARLTREGTYYVQAEMPHAVTDTAPGHAVLFTGEPPRTSGIFGNEVVAPSGE